MSDVRFTIIGIILIFVGFIVLGIFGSIFVHSSVESQEFDDCFEYFDNREPVPIDCDVLLHQKILFFVLVAALIISGIVVLIKGISGTWDQDVKPEDMSGPNKPTGSDSNNSK